MKKIATPFDSLYILKPNVFCDERGAFIKPFNTSYFRDLELDGHFVESYFSISKRGVIRGMHFQIPPFEHHKLVYVSSGAILDVVIDLRCDSNTFKQYFSTLLDERHHHCLYISKGFAHGFLSLEDNTKVHYMQTSEYNPQYDSGILFDSFGFDWQSKAEEYACSELIISKRDREFARLDEFITRRVF